MHSIINDLEYDFNSRTKIIRELAAIYPFLKVHSIGRSVLGKDLTAVTVGEGKTRVLFLGGTHGSEHITSLILLKFLEEISFCYQNNEPYSEINLRLAFSERKLTVIPCINPDGCDIAIKGNVDTGIFKDRIATAANGDFRHWNANARGVDLNHNFPVGWEELHRLERENGIYSYAKRQFGGKRPVSEPETAAVVDYCRKNNFRHALSFHSQGEVIYWNYGNKYIENAEKMAEIMSVVSGYKPDEPTGLAVGGGFKDWFITEFSQPAFTVEVGRGENPLPVSDAPEILDRIREMLILSVIM